MKRAEIEEKLLNIVEKHFQEDKIYLSDSFVYTLGADSLNLVELLMETEQAFNLHLDETEFKNADTIQEAANLLCKIIPADDYQGLMEPYKPSEKEMWERLYVFMDSLKNKIEKYPLEKMFTIEMDVDLFKFCNRIGFIPECGIFNFQGRAFVLG